MGKAKHMDQTQWRRYNWLIYGYGIGASLWKKEVESGSRPSLNKELIPYLSFQMNAEYDANQWRALFGQLKRGFDSLEQIVSAMEQCLKNTADPNTMEQIQNILFFVQREQCWVNARFKTIYVDFPLCVQSLVAYVKIQNEIGFFNDDEDRMEQHMYDFSRMICAEDVFENALSPCSAELYAQLIALVKKELGETRYGTFITKCKLIQPKPRDGRMR